MDSKSTILNAIKQNTLDTFPMPDLSELESISLHYEDKVAQFSKVLQQVGGHAICLKEGQSVSEAVRDLYPGAQRVAWSIEEKPDSSILPGSVFNPDDAATAAELNGTDVAVIPSQLGVCENACCWIEQRVRHRAIYFIAEALVIVLPKSDLVCNMHEDYQSIPNNPDVPYATFISGPSKTADIEQALVMGAHGAKEVTVILI